MTVGSTDPHRHIVPHHLGRHHGQRFGLGGVDFARHNGRTRLVIGNNNFTNSATGSRRKHADIVANFHQRNRNAAKRPGHFDQGIVGRQGFKFVGRRPKRLARKTSDVRSRNLVVILRRIQAGSHRRSPQGQLRHHVQGVRQGPPAVVQLLHIGRKFLAQAQRRGIHKMRPPCFDQTRKFFGLGIQSLAKRINGRQRTIRYRRINRDMHGRWKGVVGALRAVHIVVGVQEFGRIRQETPAPNMGPVRNHLVHIHVGLGPAPGLPNHQGKFAVQGPRDDFIADFGNGIPLFDLQNPQFVVGVGGRLFENPKRMDDFQRHATLGTNFEIIARALCLGAPITVDGHLDLAHGVFFDAKAGMGKGIVHGPKVMPSASVLLKP